MSRAACRPLLVAATALLISVAFRYVDVNGKKTASEEHMLGTPLELHLAQLTLCDIDFHPVDGKNNVSDEHVVGTSPELHVAKLAFCDIDFSTPSTARITCRRNAC